jgi:hypothetical protein
LVTNLKRQRAHLDSTDRSSDCPSLIQGDAAQPQVPRHEEVARTYGARAERRGRIFWPFIGHQGPKSHFSDFGQRTSDTPDRPIEEYGDVEGVGDPLGSLVTKRNRPPSVVGFEGDEGNDVDNPETWMDAFVTSEVQGRERGSQQCVDVSRELTRVIDERENAAVVECVSVQVTK